MKPYLLLSLSEEEAHVAYQEILAGLMCAEEQCKRSKNVEQIPVMMSRIATLNTIQEKMNPHVTLLGIEREQHPDGGSSPRSGNR